MQWLNLESVGSRLELVRRNSTWYFFITMDGTNQMPAFDPTTLGFKPYQAGWIKPSDWQTIASLKLIPGAIVCDMPIGQDVINTKLSDHDDAVKAFLNRQEQSPNHTNKVNDHAKQSKSIATETTNGNPPGNGVERPTKSGVIGTLQGTGDPGGTGSVSGGSQQDLFGSDSAGSEEDLEGAPAAARTESGGYAHDDETAADGNADSSQPVDEGDLGVHVVRSETENEPIKDLNPEHFFITVELERQGGFNPTDRYRDNIDAIKTLKALEEDDAPATPAQKSILARYAGWGGLKEKIKPDGYSYNKPGAIQDYRELKSLLSEKELESAAASILNAHFTPKSTIQAVWTLLEQMGFEGGRIIETSAGVGNFIGLAPPEIVRRSEFHAIENDPLTGKMLSKIYPDVRTHIKGFEDTKYPDDFFDLAISNVPFGNYSVYDADYDRYRLHIHDYFFVKALDKLKPGGVAALITSRYTLDKLSEKARTLIHERAELIGAIRLPNNAQKAQAGTEVVTDLIFLQKRTSPLPIDNELPGWLKSVEIDIWSDKNKSFEQYFRNTYFSEHPDQVLGVEFATMSQFGPDYTVVPYTEAPDLGSAIVDSAQRFARKLIWPKEQVNQKPIPSPVKYESVEVAKPKIDVGSYIVHDNKLVVVRDYDELLDKEGHIEGYEMRVEPSSLKGKTLEKVLGLITIRDLLKDLIDAQLKINCSDQLIESLQGQLNEEYDNFVRKYGYLNNAKVIRPFLADPACGRLMALEHYDEEQETATKADIFYKRVIEPHLEPEISSYEDALAACLENHGSINVEYLNNIGSHLPGNYDTVVDALLDKEKIFKVPETGKYEIASIYLAGDVRKKLEYAKAAGPQFERHVELLESLIPEDIPKDQIEVRVGASWIPHKILNDFIKHMMEISDDGFSADFSSALGTWKIRPAGSARNKKVARLDYGTPRIHFFSLLERLANNRDIAVYDIIDDGESERRVLNLDETIAAKEKAELIKDAFTDFIWNHDPVMGDKLHRRYNELYNSYVEPVYDGSHLTLPGCNPNIQLRPVQKNAIWRYIVDGRVLYAHEVGVGKTWEIVGACMESKRLGFCNTSAIVVKNKMLNQFVREAYQLYPNARITTINNNATSSKKSRSQFLGQVSNNNYDLVIIPYSVYEKIKAPIEFQEQYINNEIMKLRFEIEEVKSDDKESRARFQAGRIETKIKNLETQLKRALSDHKKDKGINFGELGIDALAIDEAHNFKNMDAQKSVDMAMKISFVQEKNEDMRGLILATATPISNSLDEIYVMQNYLQPDLLDYYNMTTLNGWRSNYIQQISQFEPSPSGSGFVMRSRDRLVNAPEIMSIWKQHMDVVFADDAGIERPDVETITHVAEMTPGQIEIKEEMAKRAENPTKYDNILKIVSDGRKMSLHGGLYKPEYREEHEELFDSTKLGDLVKNVKSQYDQHREHKNAQLVFCDLGTPGGSSNINIYELIKERLVHSGISEEQIAFIHTPKNDREREALYAKVRSGDVSVLIGSTEMMSEGLNVQERLSDLHLLTAPWKPSTMDQIIGRARRFGNIFSKVGNGMINFHIYTTKGSMDAFLFSTLKNKAEAFGNLLRGAKDLRELSLEVDPTHAEVLALTTDNPLIKIKMESDQALRELQALKSSHNRERNLLEYQLRSIQYDIDRYQEEIRLSESFPKTTDNNWTIEQVGLSKPLFSGARPKMLKIFRTLIGKANGSIPEGVTLKYGSIPVEYNASVEKCWRLSAVKGYGFKRAADVEEFIENLNNGTEFNQRRIEKLAAQKEEVQAELKRPFSKEEELSLARRRVFAIEQMINEGVTDQDEIDLRLSALQKSLTAPIKADITSQRVAAAN